MSIEIKIYGDNYGQATKELLGFVSEMHVETTKLAGGTKPTTTAVAGVQANAPANTATPAAVAAKPAEPAATAAAAAPAAAAKEEPKAEAAKPAAKAAGKKAAAPAVAAPAVEAQPRPTDETTGTLDNARLWITYVNQEMGKTDPAKGLAAAGKIIKSFGVAKVSDIGDDAVKYADFVKKCVETLGAPVAAAVDVASMM